MHNKTTSGSPHPTWGRRTDPLGKTKVPEAFRSLVECGNDLGIGLGPLVLGYPPIYGPVPSTSVHLIRGTQVGITCPHQMSESRIDAKLLEPVCAGYGSTRGLVSRQLCTPSTKMCAIDGRMLRRRFCTSSSACAGHTEYGDTIHVWLCKCPGCLHDAICMHISTAPTQKHGLCGVCDVATHAPPGWTCNGVWRALYSHLGSWAPVPTT